MMRKRMLALLLTALTVLLLTFSATGLAAYATLRYRDTGDAVTQLQQALTALGYSTGGVDGKFGLATDKAVRQFQQENGLTADGLAGNKTQTMIYARLAEAQTTQAPAAEATPTPAVQTAAPQVTAAPVQGTGTGLFSGDYATLKYGSRGDRVTILQQALNDLGLSVGSVDGRFGLGTQKAVTAFQKRFGLTADGLAGRNTLMTLEALFDDTATDPTAVPITQAPEAATATPAPATATPAPTAAPTGAYTIPTRTLRKGTSGEDVRSVQARLTELGYYSGSLDGVYGTGSIAAIKAFQKKNGLTADGLAGSRTNTVLFSSEAISATGGTIATVTATPSTTEIVVTATPVPVSPTAAPSYATLRVGSTGAEVTAMQTALLGYKYTVTVNGSYDAVTKAAVVSFQQRNNLTADGVAGPLTLTKLYSGSVVTGDTALSTPAPGTGVIDGPATSEIKLLHWFNDIKPTIKSGQTILVYDPATHLSWTLRLYSLGRHADSEPLTLTDTQVMYQAFGNQNTWNQKAVYVRLPSGVWTVAATHNMPHLSGSISGNGFDGHLCVHFLRDMDECSQNDPKYGVANQKTIRAAWKALTGETVD